MARLLLGLLMFVSVASQALPVSLSNIVHATSAFAEVGDDSDGINADSSPPGALPLASHAGLLGSDTSVNEFATADALADDYFLAVASEAQGNLHHAGALAEASITAELLTPGTYVLQLDFDNLLDLVGGEARAVLGLGLSIDSQTLFDEIFSDSARIARRFVLAPGERALLDIGLLSSADGFGVSGSGSGDRYGFNLASVNITLTAVPSPSPLVLIGAALLPLLRVSRKQRA